jgi:hypothetical protein
MLMKARERESVFAYYSHCFIEDGGREWFEFLAPDGVHGPLSLLSFIWTYEERCTTSTSLHHQRGVNILVGKKYADAKDFENCVYRD